MPTGTPRSPSTTLRVLQLRLLPGDPRLTTPPGTTTLRDPHLQQWSDTSLDVINGIVPENYDFNHQYGTIPVKVVGISPSGDKGLHYQWKLNEFHWS